MRIALKLTALTFFCLCLLVAGNVNAAPRYWIYLKGKDTKGYKPEKNLSPATLSHRKQAGKALDQFSDVPLNVAYLQQLQSKGIKTRVASKWLNAVSAELSNEQLQQLDEMPFVLRAEPFRVHFKPASFKNEEAAEKASPGYSPPLKQINAEYFDRHDLDGSGIVVGLIDAGFRDADKQQALRHVFMRNQVKATLDKVDSNHNNNFFRNASGSVDTHGSTVLRHVAGYDSTTHIKSGCATGATFYLARTDDAKHEFRGEEDYWLAAMEWMDSAGVRIINTSLGYALGFDKPIENYRPDQMDGGSSAVVRAANMAVTDKDILVIVSAGNDGGNNDWRYYISTPADGKEVLSIGATLDPPYPRADYSGIGPAALPWLKPNLSCYSLNGTSFSAPVISGFAACVLQANPALTTLQLRDVLEKSANLYPYGNNYIGYGWPDAEKAVKLAKKPDAELDGAEEIKANNLKKEIDGSYTIKIKQGSEREAELFHKKDKRNVVSQEEVKLDGKYIHFTRPDGVDRTTVVDGLKVYEVIW
ncbi:MAG: S8 family serine peptidase [Bacteroidota bacterium]